MLKNIILLASIVVFIASCNQTQKKSENNNSTSNNIIKVNVSDFNNIAGELIDKKVEITAIVKHVCQHGGQRMFLIDGNSEEEVKIIVGKNKPAFNTDLEGNSIHLIGMVDELRINEDFLQEWENELKAEIEHEKSEAEHDGGGHKSGSKGATADLGQHIDQFESIANFRKQIAESEKNYISFYSIISEKFEIIEPTEK